MDEFAVGQVWERTTGPNKGRRVRVTLRLYDKMAVRSVETGRLSYVRVRVLRGKTWKLAEAAPAGDPPPPPPED